MPQSPYIDPRLPLIDLHRHLDGAVRLETVIELADQQGIELPATDVESLRPYVVIEEKADNSTSVGSTALEDTGVSASALAGTPLGAVPLRDIDVDGGIAISHRRQRRRRRHQYTSDGRTTTTTATDKTRRLLSKSRILPEKPVETKGR